MQLYLTTLDNQYTKRTNLISWVGGIDKIELKQKLGEPAELNIQVNRAFDNIWKIARDSNEIGLRLIDINSDIDIPFIKDDEGQTDTETATNFKFVSFIRSIRNSKPYYNQNQALSGFTFENITALSSDIIWQGTGSPNIQANYNTGSKNNFEILQELVKKVGWQYRENGMTSIQVPDINTQSLVLKSLPTVLLGDFSVLPVTRKITNWDTYNITDPKILNEPRRKSRVSSYKYTKVIGTLSGSGSGTGAIQLNQSVQQDAMYPIENLQIGNSFEMFINDYVQPIENQDYNSITIPMWQGATAQDLYNLALLEIEKRKVTYIYEFDIVSPTFIKAGEKIKIEYVSDTLPMFFETTVVESIYDYGTRFCKITVCQNVNIDINSQNIWQIQSALITLKEQQTAPQN